MDDTVTVSWGSSSVRDLPERGCYELAVSVRGAERVQRVRVHPHRRIQYSQPHRRPECSDTLLQYAGTRKHPQRQVERLPLGPANADPGTHCDSQPDADAGPYGDSDAYPDPDGPPTPDPTATPTPTLTPSPSPTPTATPTPTLTPTPSPTPTATPRPTATPTATPVPTPTPVPTGEWMTWPRIQALGFEGDKDGEPRILLRGETPLSTTSIVLNVDCQTIEGSRQIEVYMQESRSHILVPLPFTKTSDEVRYSVDGKDSPVREWSYQEHSGDTRVWFAPALVEEALIQALIGNPRKLVITLHPGKDYATEFVFRPAGFKRAVEPVLRFCGS